MDDFMWICLLGIALLLFVVLSRFLGGRRPPPAGTYDDEDVRSGGSFGGGQSTYDAPDVRSGGSFGSGASTYDDEDVRSGGSFGGGARSEAPPRSSSGLGKAQGSLRKEGPSRAATPPPANRAAPLRDDDDGPSRDNPNVRSGGSFGG